MQYLCQRCCCSLNNQNYVQIFLAACPKDGNRKIMAFFPEDLAALSCPIGAQRKSPRRTGEFDFWNEVFDHQSRSK